MNFKTQLQGLAHAWRHLIKQHLQHARLEMKEDIRFVSVRVGLLVFFVPLLLVGYCFLWAALALALAQVMAVYLAFLLIGAVHVIGVVIATVVIAQQLQSREIMKATKMELGKTKTFLQRK